MTKTKISGSPSNSRKKKVLRKLILQITIALIITLFTIAFCFLWKPIIIQVIYKTVDLKPNSTGYDTWLNPPTSITRGYYLFNVTNSVDLVTDPSKVTAKIRETRPYSYILSATKKHVKWSSDSKTLNYSIYRLFTRHPSRFIPSSVNDTGIFVDILRAIFRSQYQTRVADSFFAIAGVDAFYHRNAVEQLEGFTSKLFYTLQDKMTGPNIEKYGFIYRYNGSRSYNYTIKGGLMEKGQVLAFASENIPFSFSTPLPYDYTIYDGLTFVPMLFDKPSMNIFQADFCRPIRAQFNRVVNMFNGIDVHEYVIRLIDFDQCQVPGDIDTCPEVDVLDISRCISASLPQNTVLLSKVHFYGSTPEKMAEYNLEGFTPTRDQHEALIYFEPYSGTPLRAHHRLQLNIQMMIDPMRSIDDNGNLEPTGKRAVRRLLPLVWIDQEVNVDEATIEKLRMVHIALRYGVVIIVAIGAILVLVIILAIELLSRRELKAQSNDSAKQDRVRIHKQQKKQDNQQVSQEQGKKEEQAELLNNPNT